MEQNGAMINRFLVQVFHEILRIEDRCVAEGEFSDLSVRELHVIEAVCNAAEQKGNNRAADIAEALRVTPGTLTAAVVPLEKKGYLLRRRDEKDRRVVRLFPTEKGQAANRKHAMFHQEMVDDVLRVLDDPEEQRVFVRALSSVADYFNRKSEKNSGENDYD